MKTFNEKKTQGFVIATLLFLPLLLPSMFMVSCNSKSKPESQPQANTPATSHHDEHESKSDTWTCPMHPQVKKDKPGSCPICGMTLVKTTSEDEGSSDSGTHDPAKPPAPLSASEQTTPTDHASFKLSLSRQQMIGVKYGIVEKKPLFKSIRVAGRLAFDPELYTAQNEYAEALRQLERVKDSSLPDVKHSAERMVHSAKLRLKILGLSDKQIAGIGTAERSDALLINKPGSQVWVYADVYEMDLPSLQPGLSVEITAGFLAGKVLAGKVVSVDRVINPVTRTAKARILVPEAKTLLRPESYVDVTIHAPLGEQVTVPFDAILDTGDQSWVFITDGQGKFDPRLVTVKLRADDEIAIGSGLQGGEKIVMSANFLIDSESRLRGAMMPQTAPMAGAKEPAQGEAKKPSGPSCPKGQHWDAPMAMCMSDVGGQ